MVSHFLNSWTECYIYYDDDRQFFHHANGIDLGPRRINMWVTALLQQPLIYGASLLPTKNQDDDNDDDQDDDDDDDGDDDDDNDVFEFSLGNSSGRVRAASSGLSK